MISIIDYGLGNLGSIRNMFKKIGIESAITSSPDEIRRSDKLILPGVGAFDAGMRNLNASGLVDVLRESVSQRGTPLLGICLGMQLLCRASEEGGLPGLGFLAADVRKFDAAMGLPVPHMGWGDVSVSKEHALTAALPLAARFYFVHSYRVVCDDPADELLSAEYGVRFTAGFASGNILGVQFHPEKSHKFGMALLTNFARM